MSGAAWSVPDLAAAGLFLSPGRLAPHQEIAGTLGGAIALHQQCLRIAGALYPAIGVVEIALRNAVITRLATRYGAVHWLQGGPGPVPWQMREPAALALARQNAQRDAYSKMDAASRHALDAALPSPAHSINAMAGRDRLKHRREAIAVSDGQIVAHLMLGFWKGLFSDHYERTLWRDALQTIFPSRRIRRKHVATHLEEIYQSRNRIAHHEKVVGGRLERTVESLTFIATHFEAEGPSDTPLARLLAPNIDAIRHEAESRRATIASWRPPRTSRSHA